MLSFAEKRTICVCVVLPLAADGATTPEKAGSQKEGGVRFKTDINLGKSFHVH